MRIDIHECLISKSCVVGRQDFVKGTPKVTDTISDALKIIHCCIIGDSIIQGREPVLGGDII